MLAKISAAWPSVFRITVGTFWLYFASTKWRSVDWLQGLVAVLLILGLATRWAGILGLLLALNLALVVAFEVGDPGFRWLYYLSVLVNAQVIVSGPGPLALARFSWAPTYLR